MLSSDETSVNLPGMISRFPNSPAVSSLDSSLGSSSLRSRLLRRGMELHARARGGGLYQGLRSLGIQQESQFGTPGGMGLYTDELDLSNSARSVQDTSSRLMNQGDSSPEGVPRNIHVRASNFFSEEGGSMSSCVVSSPQRRPDFVTMSSGSPSLPRRTMMARESVSSRRIEDRPNSNLIPNQVSSNMQPYAVAGLMTRFPGEDSLLFTSQDSRINDDGEPYQIQGHHTNHNHHNINSGRNRFVSTSTAPVEAFPEVDDLPLESREEEMVNAASILNEALDLVGSDSQPCQTREPLGGSFVDLETAAGFDEVDVVDQSDDIDSIPLDWSFDEIDTIP